MIVLTLAACGGGDAPAREFREGDLREFLAAEYPDSGGDWYDEGVVMMREPCVDLDDETFMWYVHKATPGVVELTRVACPRRVRQAERDYDALTDALG